jgi:hypothetical protein
VQGVHIQHSQGVSGQGGWLKHSSRLWGNDIHVNVMRVDRHISIAWLTVPLIVLFTLIVITVINPRSAV